MVLGDNLGSHDIGEFITNFANAIYVCPYFEITTAEFQNDPFDRKELRTIESYTECLHEAVRRKKAIRGIKSDSPLNILINYHVCRPGLPPGIAHDLFEGFVSYDLYLALEYLEQDDWFTFELLNSRLNNVEVNGKKIMFIPNVTDKSKSISKKLTGSASQIKALLMVLPLAIADCVQDIHDNVWKMILKLRDVCNMVCAPALSGDQLIELKNSIEDYITLRLKCFPKVKLRPKHVYLMHYDELIPYFGPLKHLQTLRCESKHGYFKGLMEHYPKNTSYYKVL